MSGDEARRGALQAIVEIDQGLQIADAEVKGGPLSSAVETIAAVRALLPLLESSVQAIGKPQLGGRNDLDLPYLPEDHPQARAVDPDTMLAGGVVVSGAVVPVAGVPFPALLFRFADVRGGFYPPTLLVCEDDQLAKARPLIQEAIAGARRAASIARPRVL